MIFNQSEKQEKEYLHWIIDTLKNNISDIDNYIKEQEKTLKDHKDYLWQARTDIDAQEVRSMRESILNTLAIGESVIGRKKQLQKLLDVTYFGRVDFKDCHQNSKILPIYIGVNTFYDRNLKMNLIYDWRAPISGIFYDYELGEASYDSPEGKIEGSISLKRQYRIRKGVMEYMIESSLTIHDDILQKELSAGTNDKMKNIVATIQKEQNKIIRNNNTSILIIQGVAGSGKTSIALHRIAYLLYTHKGIISSKDILIISPNKVFADYISNVLPELGEESVPEVSFEQILSEILENKYKYQNFFEQVTELLEKPTPEFTERIKYKASFEFISQLDKFILHIENNYFKATDVKLNSYFTIPAEFIEEQFRRFNRYPLRQRFEPMINYIVEITEIRYRFIITTIQRNLLKKEVKRMFCANNDIQVYKDFFQWIGKPEMLKTRKNHTLEYSDLAPLAYLHIALEGYNQQSNVKHLLVDEMQDYSPIQYKILQKIYPCKKTILGDASQSVNPYGSSNADIIRKTFASGEVMKLCKSYRSTYEITDFAQRIRTNNELDPVGRHGDYPQVLKYDNVQEEILGITDLISTFKKSNHQSLGIICKTELQAKEVSEKLKTYDEDISFLSNQSSAFIKGIIITSAHMAKGLEFDEVIISQVNDKNYCTEIDRSMLYVAVTRAMHKLTLTYTNPLSKFITHFI